MATKVDDDDITEVTDSNYYEDWESMRTKSKYYKSSMTVFRSISMLELA
jgi:hypothetical protein